MTKEFRHAAISTTTAQNEDTIVQGRERRTDLSVARKHQIINMLTILMVEGQLPVGAIKDTATKVGLSRKTVSELWNKVKDSLSDLENVDLSSKRPGNGGRKRLDRGIIDSMVKMVPLCKRTSLRSLSVSMAATGTAVSAIS